MLTTGKRLLAVKFQTFNENALVLNQGSEIAFIPQVACYMLLVCYSYVT